MTVDNKHRILHVNKAMAERLRVKPEQCIGLHCYRVVHDPDSYARNLPA
ncbi:MAG: PAS domain-containing protein [Candidatus Bathyarchaeia archaeon]